MSGMELAGFEATSGFEDGDRIKASDLVDTPLLVYVVDRKENITTRHSPPPGKPGLILDILNLQNQEVFLSVLWMNNQIVDNLSRYVGRAVAIKLEWRKSKTQNDYLTVLALEGEEANVAQQWVNAKPNLFVDARKERELGTHEEIRGSSVTAVNSGVNPSPAAATPPPAAATPPPVPTQEAPAAAAPPPPASAAATPPPVETPAAAPNNLPF